MNKIKAVIFDMDGVIVDSEPTQTQIESELIKKYAKQSLKSPDRFLGVTEKYFWQTVCQELDIKKTPTELMTERSKIYEQRMLQLPLFPHVKNLFKKIKDRGLKTAVASSSYQKWIEQIIQHHHLDCNILVSGEFVKNSKPFPDIFLETANRLRLSPKECLVIEDSINGITAAKAAGMKCVAITNTFPKEKLSEADYIINNLNEFNFNWLQ